MLPVAMQIRVGPFLSMENCEGGEVQTPGRTYVRVITGQLSASAL